MRLRRRFGDFRLRLRGRDFEHRNEHRCRRGVANRKGGRPWFFARSRRFEAMRADIDRRRDPAQAGGNGRAVERHDERALVGLRRDRHDHLREAGFEPRDAFARRLLARRLPFVARGRGGGAVCRPCARGLPSFLVARGEVQDCANARIEPLAVGEFGARFGKSARLHEAFAFVEERVRGGGVVGACWRGRAEHEAESRHGAKSSRGAARGFTRRRGRPSIATCSSGAARHPHFTLLVIRRRRIAPNKHRQTRADSLSNDEDGRSVKRIGTEARSDARRSVYLYLCPLRHYRGGGGGTGGGVVVPVHEAKSSSMNSSTRSCGVSSSPKHSRGKMRAEVHHV